MIKTLTLDDPMANLWELEKPLTLANKIGKCLVWSFSQCSYLCLMHLYYWVHKLHYFSFFITYSSSGANKGLNVSCNSLSMAFSIHLSTSVDKSQCLFIRPMWTEINHSFTLLAQSQTLIISFGRDKNLRNFLVKGSLPSELRPSSCSWNCCNCAFIKTTTPAAVQTPPYLY